MKRVTILSLICLFVFSCTTIQQNEEGVAIHRTERDSSKVYEAVKGRIFTVFDFNTDYVTVPMYQQKGRIRHIEMKTSDRSTFSIDSIEYTYTPIRGSGVTFIKSYRQFTGNDDFMDIIEKQTINLQVGIALSKIGANYSSDSVLTHTQTFKESITKELNRIFKDKQLFTFEDINFEVHEPAAIKAILEAKAKSFQEAEAAKAEATKAQSRQLVIEAEQKSRVAEAKADLEVATLQAQERRITTATYSKEYLDFLRITYWGEAKCPAQTVFLYGTQAVDLQK